VQSPDLEAYRRAIRGADAIGDIVVVAPHCVFPGPYALTHAEALGCEIEAHGRGEFVHDLPRACARHCPRSTRAAREGQAVSERPLTDEEREQIEARILALETEHHDLDDVIARLASDPTQDQLQLRRLKKKKLLLKDLIARLRDRLIPDIIA
jgi:hypothetical protein